MNSRIERLLAAILRAGYRIGHNKSNGYIVLGLQMIRSGSKSYLWTKVSGSMTLALTVGRRKLLKGF